MSFIIIYFNSFLFEYEIRSEYVKRSFAILSHELLVGIIKLFAELNVGSVVELAAGKGWLSYWLVKYSIPVLGCFDNMSWDAHFMGSLDFVENKDSVKAVKDFPDVKLFVMCWPPYDNSMAYDVFDAMKEGQYLLYIGEGWGGCNADDKFFNTVRNHEIEVGISLLQFKGLRDHVFLYKK